jgi:hypothetical protein
MIPGLGGVCGGTNRSTFSGAYLGSDSSSIDGTTFNLGTQVIGAVPSGSDDRYIIVGATIAGNSFANVSSVTLGGNSVTKIIDVADGLCVSWIGYILVNSGTTANVTVTASSSCIGCAIHLWRVINWSGTAFDTASDSNGSPLTLTIDVPGSGLVASVIQGRNSGSPAWSSATERSQVDVNSSDYSGAADYTNPLGTTESGRLVSCSASSPDDFTGVAVAFGG